MLDDESKAQSFFVLVLTLGAVWLAFLVWAIYTLVTAISGAL